MAINRPNVFSPAQSSTPDFFFDVARGAYGDFYQTLNIAGYKTAIGTADEIISFQSGFEPYVADTYKTIVSNSTQDQTAGTGAKTVRVTGVDASGDFLQQTVTMTGAVPVTFPVAYTFVNEVKVMTAGTNYNNVGTLTIENAPSGDSIDIAPNTGRSQFGAYLVPNGYRLVVMSSDFTIANADVDCNVTITMRKYRGIIEGAPVAEIVYRGVTSLDNAHEQGSFFQSTFPLLFNPGEMVTYWAQSSAASNSIAAVQGYGVLMQDS